MDMTESIAPKSDQLNADDLLAGPRTFTIEKVGAGSDEQPVNVHLVELPGRPYRPSKSMRRVMVAAWGKDASAYSGHGVTLYRNPEITFGREKVGGIEISHLSHIENPLTVALTATRGRKRSFTVKPLATPAASTPTPPHDGATEAQIAALVAALNAAGHTTSRQKGAAISAQLGSAKTPHELTGAEADWLVQVFEAEATDGAEGN